MPTLGALIDPRSNSDQGQSSSRRYRWFKKKPHQHLRLPLELVLQILSYIHARRDLKSLAAVSRALRQVIEPRLWEVIELNDDMWRSGRAIPKLTRPRLFALYRSMKVPQIGSHISIFRLHIHNKYHCRYCSYAGGNIGQLCVRLVDSCQCNKLDKQLGAVLVDLPNLRVLSLSCQLVHRLSEERHPWLEQLKTNVLQELELGCAFLPWKIIDYQRLLTPCMRNLRAVKLDAWFPMLDTLEYFMPLREEFFPLLDTLAYRTSDSSALRDWLIRNRPIKRLVCIYYDQLESNWIPSFTRTIAASTCQLELLYGPDISRWLPSQNPSPYVNITSLGTVFARKGDTESNILQSLQPLSYMKNLRLLEFGFIVDPIPTTWSEYFFAGLGIQHPSLVNIYLVTRPLSIVDTMRSKSAILYERNESGEWSFRQARHLNFWQIANGESYDLDSRWAGTL